MSGEAGGVVVTAPSSEESVAAAGEAAVAIAEIEAERDVTLAEINTEANLAATEAVTEGTRDEDVEWLRAELAGLRARCETNEAALSRLDQTMAAMAEQNAELRGLIVGLTANLSPPPPPSGTEGTGEVIPAASGEGPGEASPGEISPVKRRERVWL